MPRNSGAGIQESLSHQPAVGAAADAAAANSNQTPRRVLVLAYYFPPMGMSGVQRTAKFVKYLPSVGWHPTVVTCEPRGYFAFDQSLWEEIENAGIEVIRTRGWDPTRLFRPRRVVALPGEQKRRWLSVVSQLFFIPDNKIGWFGAARRAGLDAIERDAHDVIFSSAPPYTAHLVGRSLSKRTGRPLVLDFRDDWVGNPRHFYPTPLHRAASIRLERKALAGADCVLVINDVIRRNLHRRNKDLITSDRIEVLSQGFDPDDFQTPPEKARDPALFTILYSGVFYDVQTPDYFLRAVADLLSRRTEIRAQMQAVFVGMLPKSTAEIIDRFDLHTVVQHTGYLPHDEVIAYLQTADVLWMTVGRGEGSESISTSKLFEYFGAKKPVLGLVPEGAAREALEHYGAGVFVEPDSIYEISAAIERLYDAWEQDRLPFPDASVVEQFDRRRLTRRLGQIFESALSDRKQQPGRLDI